MTLLSRRAVAATLSALAVIVPATMVGALPASAAGTTVYISPGADVQQAMENLRAGDRLVLRPGVYSIGYIRPLLAKGSPTAPIVMTGQYAGNRPLILGGLQMTGADNWRLWNIRVEANTPGMSALYMNGGRNWQVRGSEFYGAQYTGSYANVAIAGSGGQPSNFTFMNNCVHDAGRVKTRNGTDHNIYVGFIGAPGSGGLIEYNTIYGHPNGSGIKLGSGGVTNAPGPWGVRVIKNTIAYGGHQILFHGAVRNNFVSGNILGPSTAPFHASPSTVAIYVNQKLGPNNVISHNYVWGSTMAMFDTYRQVRDLGDDKVRPQPGFRGSGCSGYIPTYRNATPYGRTGVGAYPRW